MKPRAELGDRAIDENGTEYRVVTVGPEWSPAGGVELEVYGDAAEAPRGHRPILSFVSWGRLQDFAYRVGREQ